MENKIPTPPLETPVQVRDAIRILFNLARENNKSAGRGQVLSVSHPRVDDDRYGIQFYDSKVFVGEDGTLEIGAPAPAKFVPWPIIPQVTETNTTVSGGGGGGGGSTTTQLDLFSGN